jgi:two-component system, chemotaxis family, response regulator Rcp1
MDGYAVLGAIRDDPRLRTLPVIVLTSSSADDDVNRCYDATANAYVTKPARAAEFASVLAAIDRFWLDRAVLP